MLNDFMPQKTKSPVVSAVGHLVDAVSDLIRSVEGAVSSVIHPKRGPGRPKGSKNKRGPGRPKGSKNKRGPGRPKGSKNRRGPGRPPGSKTKRGPGRPPKAARRPGQRGPGKNNPRLKSALKSYWANLTPAQRAERVRKMQAGRRKRR
jgi:hypothetical protein